jgi:putative nucleotidyltransferase with HDIG domain
LKYKEVSIIDVVSSISEAIDLVNPNIDNHHITVASIAANFCCELNLSADDYSSVFLASLLHDCGTVSETTDERMELFNFEEINIDNHAKHGYELLKDFKPLEKVAQIILYHHSPSDKKNPYNILSQIIHLADRIAVLIRKHTPILVQAEEIIERLDKNKELFDEEVYQAFLKLSKKEYFWLDAVNPSSIEKIKLSNPDFAFNMPLDLNSLLNYAELVRKIIDHRSPFTSMHSDGIAYCAEELARLSGFNETECLEMRIAGFLHDLGKLAVPVEILNKPAGLTKYEYAIIRTHTYYTYKILNKIPALHKINTWGAYHHEKLDGTGYPFHYKAENLSKGSRIMAIIDIFVALTENRPYRKGMSVEAALKIIEEMVKNGKLDGEIFNLLKENSVNFDKIRQEAQKRNK